MRYELNFDEDKVNDVLVVGGASYDLKGCCDLLNKQQATIEQLKSVLSKRFFTKINKNGRNVIIDKECHIEIIDLTLACEVLNRLDLKLKHYNEVNGEQQATIKKLEEENRELRQSVEYWQKKYEEGTETFQIN